MVTLDVSGEVSDRQTGQAEFFAEELGNGPALEMVSIPGGTFEMGSPLDEPDRQENQGPQRSVVVSPFFLGKYPITQAQWRSVASLPQVQRPLDADPSHFKGDDRPVEMVTWEAAVEFCERLSAKTGRLYRLPSEAEWEYACRAGTNTPYHFGEALSTRFANFKDLPRQQDDEASEDEDGWDGAAANKDTDRRGDSGSKQEWREKTTPVDRFDVANAFGLFDMHGNVWEWCADPWHNSYDGAPTTAAVWEQEGDVAKRVLRGGSWYFDATYARSAHRDWVDPDGAFIDFGLRVACSIS
jgi:formylglycine-generating enzyme required for sulfatase activity